MATASTHRLPLLPFRLLTFGDQHPGSVATHACTLRSDADKAPYFPFWRWAVIKLSSSAPGEAAEPGGPIRT